MADDLREKFEELAGRVAGIDKGLAVHLVDCARTSAETGRDIKSLKRVVWWAATGLIGGQFIIIAFFCAQLAKNLFR